MQIEIQEVHYAYPGGIQALNGVSLSIASGEQAAFIGQNGSGKTTLAKHLNGLLRPQQGNVRIGDWQTEAYTPAQLARRVAYVFQNPDEQLFKQRIWDEVAFGPQNLGHSPALVQTLVEQALSWVRLEGQANVNPRDLGYSGRKWVALAGALAMDTPVLVFDEPTAGLDTGELNLLAAILQRLRGQNKTVVMVTHDMDFVAENIERCVLIDRGRVVLDASTAQVFAQQALLEATRIQPPQIARLGRLLGLKSTSLTPQNLIQNLHPDYREG